MILTGLAVKKSGHEYLVSPTAQGPYLSRFVSTARVGRMHIRAVRGVTRDRQGSFASTCRPSRACPIWNPRKDVDRHRDKEAYEKDDMACYANFVDSDRHVPRCGKRSCECIMQFRHRLLSTARPSSTSTCTDDTLLAVGRTVYCLSVHVRRVTGVVPK